MRILFVSQYFPPEPGAPAARVSELASRWAAAGHEVAVVTGFPNHPTGVVPEAYRGRWWMREKHHGVEVLRVPIYATPNRGVLRRSVAYVSFSVSASVLGAAWGARRNVDVIVATSPQILVAVSGDIIRRVLRRPWVLEIRDLWPESIVDLGVFSRGRPWTRALYRLERYLYRRADRLCGVTPAFARHWVRQGVPAEKIVTVENGVDRACFAPRPTAARHRAKHGWGGDFVILYIGTHGLAQGLGVLLDAAVHLRSERSLRFVFVGDGAERSSLMRRAKDLALTRVEFHPSQPRADVPDWLSAADLAVVCLRDRPVFEQVLPSKMFEIMACGRPIVMASRGESAELLQRAGAGWIVPPEDPLALAEAILAAKRDPEERSQRGRSGLEFVTRNYDRDVLATRYLEVLKGLVHRSRR